MTLVFACFTSPCSVQAMIGGQSAVDGPAIIDDVEDLDLTADPLGRDWISDFVGGVGGSFILSALDLSSSGLSLAPGQTPAGALKAEIPNDGFGSINSGFGVPMPGDAGASTEVSPGDVTSFERLAFQACFEPGGLSNQTFQILLECYPQNPNGTFPKILWNYTPAEGTTFDQVTIELLAADAILDNTPGHTVEELLSQTRFLFFFFFASPVSVLTTLNAHIDDIQLQGEPPIVGTIAGKTLQDSPVNIDDAEDLDLTADPLGRDWVPDFVGGNPILSALDLTTAGLTLAAGQTPLGGLKATVPDDGFGSINAGFGVPLPGEVGLSTEVSPGFIVDFDSLNFLACFEPAGLPNQTFQILLECYPENDDGTFPTLIWDYSPAAGGAFEPVSIDIASPDAVLNNPDALTVNDLLSRTRFLFFFFFANPVGATDQLDFHVDDVQLQGQASSQIANWQLY